MAKELSHIGRTAVSFPPKTMIFRENDFTKDVFILKKGRVNLYKKMGNKNLLLGEIGSGTVFGELSIIDGGPRSATAITATEVDCAKLTPLEFTEGLKTVPDWFLAIARVLAQRLRATDKQLNLNGPVANEANVCAILVYMFGGVEEDEKKLPLTNVEEKIYDLLRISINELEQIFEKLEKARLVSLTTVNISLPSVETLETHLESVRDTLSKTFVI